MAALAQDVESRPDDYQRDRARRLGVGDRAIGYALQRLAISYKKHSAPKMNQRGRFQLSNQHFLTKYPITAEIEFGYSHYQMASRSAKGTTFKLTGNWC